MIEYKEEKKREFFEGVELASFSASYPETEGKEKINSFFSGIVSNSRSWFLEMLFEHAKREYENDTDEKKRFHFKPYRYSLSIKEIQSTAGEISFELCVRLLRGKKDQLASFSDALVFDTEKQIIKAPVKEKRKRK